MAPEQDRAPLSTEISPPESEVDLYPSVCWTSGVEVERVHTSVDAAAGDRLAIGQTISGRYRIERELGEGGMGVVYLATDEQVVGETFAIKVLKERLHPEALSLLREEVHETRRLSHPNIVDVHSVNVDGTKLYVLMEYLEGKSLNALLDEEFGRGMSFSHAWPIIEDVGAALGYAHDHNVIHSDLKPANVFVTTSGRTKLLDFGVARVSRGPLLHKRSGPRALTPTYASCEMLTGEEADRRDDIYSFACVIYEMLSGERPFGELTAVEAREAGSRVAPLEMLTRGQNAALAKALAFQREERTSSVEKLLKGLGADKRSRARATAVLGGAIIAALAALSLTYLVLDRLRISGHSLVVHSAAPDAQRPALPASGTGATVNPPPHSIAVLPFVNMSGDKGQDYFSDGLTEELLNSLARINELQVAARTSSFAFKDKPENISTIARDLHVAYVLEGSVRKDGNHVRITAQLIRADSGYHLWSDTYDRTLDGVFKLQDQIAGAVIQALQVKLLGGSLPVRQAPASQEAYDLYLQGRFFAGLYTREGFKQSLDYLDRAVKLDPGYEPLWTQLSLVYAGMAAHGFMPNAEALTKARDAVRQAIALNSKSARAHIALGYLHMNDDWNWTAADGEIGKALALEPGSSDVLHAAGTLDLVLGRVSDGVRMLLAALARDPLRASSYSNLGVAYFADDRLPEAEEAFRESIQLRPNAGYTHNGLGLVLLWKSDLNGALEEMKRETDEMWRLEGEALVYSAMHRRAESDAALAELTDKYRKESPYVIATVYGYRGEVDPAFQWLERALKERDATLTSIKSDPLFQKIKSDPRYAALLKKVGLPL